MRSSMSCFFWQLSHPELVQRKASVLVMIYVINDGPSPKFSWANPAPCCGAHCLMYMTWTRTGNWQLGGKSASERVILAVSFQRALRISVKPGHSLWKQFYFYQHQVKPAVNGPLKKPQGTSVFLHTCINSFPLQVKMFTNVSHLGMTSCSLNLLMDFKPYCQTTQPLTAKTKRDVEGPKE